jgi:SAM-dependent methyltransferase
LIYAVDKSSAALEKWSNPNRVLIQKQQLDFVNELLRFEELDGVLMANSLHFVRDKIAFLAKLRPCLKTQGQLLIVEYDTDVSNPWVPYPTSYKTLKALLEKYGFSDFTKLGERPSLYQKGNMYAVIATINGF